MREVEGGGGGGDGGGGSGGDGRSGGGEEIVEEEEENEEEEEEEERGGEREGEISPSSLRGWKEEAGVAVRRVSEIALFHCYPSSLPLTPPSPPPPPPQPMRNVSILSADRPRVFGIKMANDHRAMADRDRECGRMRQKHID
ncbi:hypothetical protein M0802_000099 [Mischocyttarus mexicanus]|nr:hypothetical protein M0802_000099 [Mischocyttarus mexicanus]